MAVKKKHSPVIPNHYDNETYSCIDVIEDLYIKSNNNGFVDYNRFQAFKYLWRLGNKDSVLQDLKKAKQYMDFAIHSLENEIKKTK